MHTSYSLLTAGGGGELGPPCRAGVCRGPPQDLWDQHREWFWPRSVGHKNSLFAGQLCWHNKSLIEYVTKAVRKVLRENPNAGIISVSQNDNGYYCNDSVSQQIIQQEGTRGGPLFRAVVSTAAPFASSLDASERNLCTEHHRGQHQG